MNLRDITNDNERAVARVLRGRKTGLTITELATRTGLGERTVRSVLRRRRGDLFACAGTVRTGLRGQPPKRWVLA